MEEIMDFFESSIESLIRDSERLQVVMNYVEKNENLDRKILVEILGIQEKQKFQFK